MASAGPDSELSSVFLHSILLQNICKKPSADVAVNFIYSGLV